MGNFVVLAGIILFFIGLLYSIYQIPLILFGLFSLQTDSKLEDPDPDPLVSIIIPVKNEEKVIARCLDSILNQDYQNFEVIVVEDGSTDNSFKICMVYQKRDARIRCYHRDSSNGKPSALNYALRLSKGEIIATFDADSVLEKDTIINAINEIYSKKLDALQGENYPLNHKENLITRMSLIDYALTKFSLLGRSRFNLFVPVGGSNEFFRKKCFFDLQGWNEDFLTEDLEISVRMSLKKMRTRYSSIVRCGQETPANIYELKKQRVRWMRGYHQVLFHRVKKFTNIRDFDAFFVTSAPLVSSFWFLGFMLILLGNIISNPTQLELLILLYMGVFLLALNILSFVLISLKNLRYLVYLPIAYIYWFILSIISFYSLFLELTGRKRVWAKVTKTGKIVR